MRLLIIGILVSQTIVFAQNKKFEGAWFDIEYPQNFSSTGSLKSSTGEGYDSAKFTSPDKKVEFYIYSPQWGGDAIDINLKSNEKLLSSESKTNGEFRIKHWTIVAKDGSYTRSYQEKLNINTQSKSVVGIKYINSDAYEKYRKSYIAFKSSLIQYAD